MNTHLEDKLLAELRFRQNRLFIPNCMSIALALTFFWDFYTTNPLRCIPFVIVLMSLGVRYVLTQHLFELYKHDRYFTRFIFTAAVGVTGLCIGVLFESSYRLNGLFSVQTLFYLGFVLTSFSGATTTLSASIRDAVTFCISTAVIPIILLAQMPGHSIILSFLLILTCSFQIYHITIIHKYLRGTLSNEITAQSQKQTLQEYIDAIPGIVGTVDMNATYTMVNNFMDGKIKNAILGTKVGETLKNNPISLMVLEFLKSKDTHWVREVHAKDLAGENWYLVNLKKISTPYEGVLVAALPINELVQTKNDLKIQEARSRYAAKLASLGELSASIAHEINNPLAIIQGASTQLQDALIESPPDNIKLAKISMTISETTQRISKIVKSLRSLSKDADDEPFTSLQFMTIVEPAQEITRPKLKEHQIILRVYDHPDKIALFGNEIQLSQVILNMISNSIDAIKNLPEKWIEIYYKPSFEWIDILIVDSGKGIPKDIRDEIMKPFFTTKGVVHGTGLGLSISKSIIENHFGYISIVEEQENTTFRIRLPRMSPWRG